MTADILRKKFLDFFKAKKHKVVESDSLVPKDDPTVLFTPAGMNQFKREFLGFTSGFNRAATSQRCLRTDDLDKVGKTPSHHTFFEMLGNFSFGDYFKKESIAWAWEFLTKELKIDKERLWVSVYKDDEEAYGIWKDEVGLPDRKIVKLGDKENFWPSEAKTKGPNGPCGPCSEIFFDQGKDVGCKREECDPSCNCPRFTEVWNLVFTQYNRKEDGTLTPLPKKNIDTGMGLERLAAVMQGKENNFETELFAPLIREIIFEVKNDNPDNRPLVYAIADHIRAIVFSIYDGVLPSNEARGYVVRKLIRRSVLYLRSMKTEKPYLYKLVPVVAEIMRAYYPELKARQENIAEIVLAEEKNFIATMNSSESLFRERFQGFIKKQDPEEVGIATFQLYDTYGIPLELTLAWLDKNNISFSRQTFNNELSRQKERSKSQSAMKGDVFSSPDMQYRGIICKFSGYECFSSKAKIIKIIKDNKEVKKLSKGEDAIIILDKTVFYPEGGGQVGDTGELTKGKNAFAVLDTKKSGKAILHTGKMKSGSLKKGDLILASVNYERRMDIARNHTATHLLQAALRQVLGKHVQQQGSLVTAEKLRFDFTHFKDISDEQTERIEETVNDFILNNHKVEVKQKALALAKKAGALAFFGEKYDSKVRVVSVGGVSSELCGGTHLKASGEIGIFKIIQEGSIASGVRRIEAVCGNAAYKVIKAQEQCLRSICMSLNVPQDRLCEEIDKRITRMKHLEKQLDTQTLNALSDSLEELIQGAEVLREIKLITKVIDSLDMNLLRKNIDLIKSKTKSSIIALGSVVGGRAMLVMGLTPDLVVKGLDAGAMIKDIAQIIGGSGGGRADFAQAGGSKPENFNQAFEKLRDIIWKI